MVGPRGRRRRRRRRVVATAAVASAAASSAAKKQHQKQAAAQQQAQIRHQQHEIDKLKAEQQAAKEQGTIHVTPIFHYNYN